MIKIDKSIGCITVVTPFLFSMMLVVIMFTPSLRIPILSALIKWQDPALSSGIHRSKNQLFG